MNTKKMKVMKTCKIEQWRVTPEIAEELLQKNYQDQRSLSKPVVNKYTADMIAGQWNEDVKTDCIAVELDQEGNILSVLNGQHRLNAVVNSGRTVKMWFVTETRNNFRYMDNGLARRDVDFMDCKNKKIVAALIKMIISTRRTKWSITMIGHEGGKGKSVKGAITREDVLSYIDLMTEQDMADMQDAITVASNIRKSKLKYGSLVSIAYVIWLEKWIRNDKWLDEFLNDMTSDFPQSLAIRAFLDTNYRENTANTKMTRPRFISLLLWSYENFKNDKIKRPTIKSIEKTVQKYDIMIDVERNERGKSNGNND